MKLEEIKTSHFFLLLILLSLATRWLSLCIDILDLDEAGHIVGSWQLMSGKLLYTEFVDNKPPLLYAYYAFAQILFGRGMFAVHLLTALLTVPLTALAIYYFWDRTFTGVCGALIFVFYSASFLAHDMLAVNSELLMILPGAWALALINTPEKAASFARVAVASLLIGIGVLFKHQIIFWLPAILIAILFQRRRWLVLSLVSGLSFAMPLVLTYAVFAWFHGERELIYWTLTNNFSYAANPIAASEAIGRAASYLIPFLLVTAPLWFLAFRSSPSLPPYRRLLSLSVLALSIPPAFIGFRFFPHYFIQLYVPLALAVAPHVAGLRAASRRLGVYTLALFLVSNLVNVYLYFGDADVYRERDPVYQRVAHRLRESACYAGGSLFVWGYAPMFYYYAKLPPASRFAILAHGGLTGYVPGNLRSLRSSTQKILRPESWPVLMDDLRRNQCSFIIDTAPAGIYRWDQYPLQEYPLLRDYVTNNFTQVATVDQVVIYESTACDR